MTFYNFYKPLHPTRLFEGVGRGKGRAGGVKAVAGLPRPFNGNSHLRAVVETETNLRLLGQDLIISREVRIRDF
jgi:hypothetical protein